MGYPKRLLLLTTLITMFVIICASRKKSKKLRKEMMILRDKETNAVDFIRLLVMRLIYGVATRVGLGENISNALNGVFVPPGVDTDDYYDEFNLEDRDDDYLF